MSDRLSPFLLRGTFEDNLRYCILQEHKEFAKNEILKTLLRICPPDSSSMDRSQQDRASREQNRMMNSLFSGMASIFPFLDDS